jgi:hypothetical protein
VSSVPALQFVEPDRPYVFPPVGVGDVLIVGVGVSSTDDQWHRLTGLEGEVAVGATYMPLHLTNGLETPWVLEFAAGVDEDGHLEFHHDVGELWADQLAATVAELPAPMSDLEVIVAWVAEHDAVRAGERRGPITRAYRSATSMTRPAWDAWYELPARDRPLDVQLTPPEVLETLASVPILVDTEAAPQREDRFIVIKSDSGIVYAAVLTAGNGAVTVLAAPDDDWDIVVTDSVVGGADEVLTQVPAEVWESLRDDERLLIVYDGTSPATARPISGDEAAALLDQWADDDSQQTTSSSP